MITSNNITGLDHIGIPTSDIEKTLDFYNGLGFKTIMRCVNAGEQVAFLKLGNLVIETYQPEKTAERSGSIDHIAIAVNDVDALFQEMLEKEYEIIGKGLETLPFWEHGVKFFKILGPNKEVLELIQTL